MNKDIRRKRTESYFIDALCDIIRHEGMGAATIRNVAEKAGYNSATIYTYFSNFSHLLLKAHFVFELELLEKIKVDTNLEINENMCQIWASAYISMTDYYLENPNIFECIFVSLYQDGIPGELRNAHNEQSQFIQFVNNFLERISIETGVQIQTIKQLHQTCLSLTVGTVLLHIKERCSLPKEEVLSTLTNQVKFLIEGQMSMERGERKCGLESED